MAVFSVNDGQFQHFQPEQTHLVLDRLVAPHGRQILGHDECVAGKKRRWTGEKQRGRVPDRNDAGRGATDGHVVLVMRDTAYVIGR